MRQAVPPSEIEGIVWLDDDVMPPADFFIKLLAHPEPIVSALYIARKPPFTPQMYEHGMARVTVADAAPLLGVSESTVRRRVQKGWYSFDNDNKITIPLADKYWPIIHYEPDSTFEVAAAGFGATWTSFEVIDSIRAQPDFKEWFTFDWPHGEDFSFCERARACGFKIIVDTSIKCAHKANIDVTEESFLSVRDKLVRLNPGGTPFAAPREGAMEVQLEGGTE